jgi:hypothetical protein
MIAKMTYMIIIPCRIKYWRSCLEECPFDHPNFHHWEQREVRMKVGLISPSESGVNEVKRSEDVFVCSRRTIFGVIVRSFG